MISRHTMPTAAPRESASVVLRSPAKGDKGRFDDPLDGSCKTGAERSAN